MKQYADTSTGQIHVRISGVQGNHAPLLCLHPIPYSGLFFDTIAPLLDTDRQVISPDYPGYGASDPLATEPTVEDYADAMIAMLDALGIDDPVDIMGFHTGCLVGPAMATRHTSRVRRLVLVDVPYFPEAQRVGMRAATTAPPTFGPEITSIEKAWQTNVSSRLGRVDPDRCMALLTEQLRSGSRANQGFGAAFSFDADACLAAVQAPCLLVATDSSLNEPTHAAAGLLQNAELRSLPNVTAPAFETGADAIAEVTRAFLDTH